MKTATSALKDYLEICETVFASHRENISKILAFPGGEGSQNFSRDQLSEAVGKAEGTTEFEALVRALSSEFLKEDLARLEKRKQKAIKQRQERQRRTGKEPVAQDYEAWRFKTARFATQRFLKNSGAYVSCWKGEKVDPIGLLDSLHAAKDRSSLLRLLVFDGFVLCDGRSRLRRVELPQGEFRVYTKQELQALMRLPPREWHDHIQHRMPEDLARWHILVVEEKEPYRGPVGIWMGGRLLTPSRWDWAGEVTPESDIELIGPAFLFLGDDANLAEEIRIRTNLFDGAPVDTVKRNGYLPWDSFDPDGNECPRSTVKQIGKDGVRLRSVYEAWLAVNGIGKKSYLRFPTEAYVRSVMGWHASKSRSMDIFVGFVTALEGVLNPDGGTEINYKTSLRGASLLAAEPDARLKNFQIINKLYKIRSKIVHEGHAGDENPHRIIDSALIDIVRHVLLRYIFALFFMLRGELSTDPSLDVTSSAIAQKTSIVSQILDFIVINPVFTARLDEKLAQLGLKERQSWMHQSVTI